MAVDGEQVPGYSPRVTHSLEQLLVLDMEAMAPGHGYLITRTREAVEQLIAHRLKREAKVVEGLAAYGGETPGATLDALVARVYADTPAALHPVARRSLHAHLIKLARDGRAVERGGRWAACA
jgi:hypothetical protein